MPEILGTVWDDFLFETPQNDRILALEGNDTIIAGTGSDFVDGGLGRDRLELDFSNSYAGVTLISSGSNSGTLSDGTNEVEFTNIEDLNIVASMYNDVLMATNGVSNIDGGDGQDTLVIDRSTDSDDLFANVSGGWNSGGIYIDSFPSGSSTQVDFFSIERLRFTSGSGNDRLEFYGSSERSLDVVDGGLGADVLVLDYFNSSTPVTSSLTRANSGSYSDGIARVEFSDIESVEISGSQFNDILAAMVEPMDPSFGPYFQPSNIDGNDGEDTLVINLFDNPSDVYTSVFNYGWDSGSLDLQFQNNWNQNQAQVNFSNIERLRFTSGSGHDWLNFGGSFFNGKEIDGGAGNDFIELREPGLDVIDGGLGRDLLVLDYSNSFTPVTSSLSSANSGSYSDGTARVEFSDIETLEVIGSNYNDVLAAIVEPMNMGFNPSLPPYNPIYNIDGRSGNDILLVDLFGNPSNLEISAFPGVLEVASPPIGFSTIDFTEIEQLEITGGRGNDLFDLTDSPFTGEEIAADAGDDTIMPGLGLDIVDGGLGRDRLVLDYFNSFSPVTSSLSSANSGSYSNGIDRVEFSDIEFLEVIGSNYNDVLATIPSFTNYGMLPPSFIDGGNGNDVLLIDLFGNPSDFEVRTFGAMLELTSLAGFSNVDFTNIEQLEITGGRGNDLYDFTNSPFTSEQIAAGAGNDTIMPGEGIDRVDGGQGRDRLVLDYSNSFTSVTSSLARIDSGSYSDGSNQVEFSNIESLEVIGSNYNDVLAAIPSPASSGMSQPGFIDGSNGNDVLLLDLFGYPNDVEVRAFPNWLELASPTGVWGVDFANIEQLEITGGRGEDLFDFTNSPFMGEEINGGAGNDTILPGRGSDRVMGGLGRDLVILDYAASTSRVLSTSYGFRSGGYSDGTNQVLFSQIESLDVVGSNFDDTLVGTAGNDRLTGGASNDNLTGGLGSDRFAYLGLGDSTVNSFDTITDFNSTEGDRLEVGFVPSSFSFAGNLTSAGSIFNATQAAYNDKSSQQTGSQPLLANEAVWFLFGSQPFVAVNDSNIDFSSTDDLLVQVTGLSGSPSVGDLFA